MTRKDYIKLAEAMHLVKPRYLTNVHQWERDIQAIADVLRADNKRFNRAEFNQACNEGTGKGESDNG